MSTWKDMPGLFIGSHYAEVGGGRGPIIGIRDDRLLIIDDETENIYKDSVDRCILIAKPLSAITLGDFKKINRIWPIEDLPSVINYLIPKCNAHLLTAREFIDLSKMGYYPFNQDDFKKGIVQPLI